MIRKRCGWCLRWCCLLAVSLSSVALSAWVMLGSLIQELPDQSRELQRLRASNDQLANQLMSDQTLVNELDQLIIAQKHQAKALQDRLSRLERLHDFGALRLISVADDRSKTVVKLQLGGISQLDSAGSSSAVIVRSIHPDSHAVVAEVELTDG